jgi:hypothetical protein
MVPAGQTKVNFSELHESLQAAIGLYQFVTSSYGMGHYFLKVQYICKALEGRFLSFKIINGTFQAMGSISSPYTYIIQ